MKTKNILISFTLLIFIFSITSCKDKCPPCRNDYKTIPQEMKDWALFEEGSWWVYRLTEDTTVFDTVRVSPNSLTDFRSNKSKCDDNNSLSTQCSETLTYKQQHSNLFYFGHPFDSSQTVTDEIVLYYPPWGGVCMHYVNGAATGTSGRIFCIDQIVIGEHYGNFTLVDTFSNSQFNNIFIKSGFHSDIITNNPPIPNSYQDVYWGKNIGLLNVQITHSNGETKNWELINYEIKQ